MSQRKSDNSASSNELLTDGVSRRNFLAYFAGAFATAALPDVLSGCSAGPETVGDVSDAVDLTSVPMTWVTRKDDGLSLGFQFVNVAADGNHNIAVTSTSSPAYIAITFPPQHIIEDAIQAGTAFPSASAPSPTKSYASGTSRIVFSVPASYGSLLADGGGILPLPYTLQGVLELCALSVPVVPAGAMTTAPTGQLVKAPADAFAENLDVKYRSLSLARIDRVIARVDPRAAARVRHRAVRAARILKRTVTSPAAGPLRPMTVTPQSIAAPATGETSLELPFRLLMAPNENVMWSFMASPVLSPAVAGVDAARTEVWHARPALLDPVTQLPDPSLGGLTLRALWTRDYDVYGPSPVTADGTGEYVKNELPSPKHRDAIVQNSGNAANPALPINHLMLSPLGGTIDLKAQFPTGALTSWTQQTVLGRDEYVECTSLGTLLPFGHPCTLVQINKRAADPSEGTVGVLYSTIYLIVNETLVSYHDIPNASDYLTFPFIAVELKQTKIPCAPLSDAGFVTTPSGGALSVAVTGTDHSGRAIELTTPLYFVPFGGSMSAAASAWNGATNGLPYAMNRQRIALATPPDGKGSGATATSYSTDGTSFETASFNVAVKTPTGGTSAPFPIVPTANTLVIAVESFRHLQSSPAGVTPNVDGTFNYEPTVYAQYGFGTTANPNPNEIFLVEASAGASPVLSFVPASGSATANGRGMVPFDGTPPTSTANGGGLVAPAFAANAISRATGTMSGTTAAGSPMLTGGFTPTDYFGAGGQGSAGGFLDQIKLFGFVPLSGLISAVEGLASEFLPKSSTQSISNVEQFLQKAIGLYSMLSGLLGADGTGTSGQISQFLGQLSNDLDQFGQLAQGLLPAGSGRGPLTNQEIQAAAWMQSANTQAQYLIQGYVDSLVTLWDDAVAIYEDIVNLDFDSLVSSDPTAPGDLQNFMTALNAIVQEVEGLVKGIEGTSGGAPGPESAIGAVLSYFGPVLHAIDGALNDVSSFLVGGGKVIDQIIADLGYLAQGLEMAKNLCAEFKWQPKISGYECLDAVAFIPSTDRALKLDIKVNASANNGPTGVTLACRLDSFAVCFGQGIPNAKDGKVCGGIDPGFTTVIKNADISVVFDHIQVSMLVGQKPDIDCVFKDLYFGGALTFVETIKNLIPLDAFSDPPFVKVTTSGITAGFTLPIPNIAIGMFSIQNINIAASLNIPWIAPDLVHGINLEFDFCTIDNPFLVTVSMLGGGGFFGMTLDMKGMKRLQFGISVGAQLAIDLTVASGSVSIEVGIFLVYTQVILETNDPVTGQPEVTGWVIGGYLRLRGELDILGIITISVELYLQIIYEASSGKCIASGFIKIDIGLFFFSIHVKVSFVRKFAGSNGDPTFAELMSPGGVNPMIDPTLTSTDPSTIWDPLAEYCMAYAA